MSREKLQEEIEQAVQSAVMRGVDVESVKETLDTMQSRADALEAAFGEGST